VQPDALYFEPTRFPPPTPVANGTVRGVGDLVYYRFVTLGTVGYGDVTPASRFARVLRIVEAIVGIMYVAGMIARFVSIQTSGANHARATERREDT
jgi:mannose/fructose/N-acetylgalactosamine-specific phosphotransferase system component IID